MGITSEYNSSFSKTIAYSFKLLAGKMTSRIWRQIFASAIWDVQCYSFVFERGFGENQKKYDENISNMSIHSKDMGF